jgi:hypothetical protein
VPPPGPVRSGDAVADLLQAVVRWGDHGGLRAQGVAQPPTEAMVSEIPEKKEAQMPTGGPGGLGGMY